MRTFNNGLIARAFCFSLALIMFSGCVHKDVAPAVVPAASTESTNTKDKVTANATSDELGSFHLTDPMAPAVKDPELDNIPTEVNPLVEKWIAYFQGRGRPLMERYLGRSTRYSALMRKILRDNGLPEDLLYVALIESGFSPRATSHAAAVGYWQFIRGTGKRYGLEINKFVDARRDPVLATQAAADYFKGLYGMFGSWYLAMAAYNVGEGRVKKEIDRNYTNNFWELVRRGKLPQETMNYVPKFLAAKLIARDPEKFGFDGIDYMPPIEFEHIKVAGAVNLRTMAEKMDYPYDELKALNPKFKGEIAPARDGELELRIPVGMSQVALTAANDSITKKTDFIADSGDTQQYKVRAGDTFRSIAKKFRTSIANIRDLNDFPKKKRLKPGMNLFVPDRSPRYLTKKEKNDIKKNLVATEKKLDDVKKQLENLKQGNDQGSASTTVAAAPAVATGSTVAQQTPSPSANSASTLTGSVAAVAAADLAEDKSHVVKSGENLTAIAHKYGVTINSIRKANNLTKKSTLKVGSRLVIPADEKKATRAVDSGARQPASKMRVHVVRKGETLKDIAQRYQVSMKRLRQTNKLGNRMRLAAGARLVIPAGIQ